MRESQKKLLISLSISLVYGLCVLFIGLIISFAFYYLGIKDPNMNQLRGHISVAEYQAIELQYGFNDPVNVQFTNYFLNFISGNWGKSYLIIPYKPVTEVMQKIVPRTLETMLLPIIIGLIGIKLGRIWVKKREKIQGIIIQVFTVIGLAIPIFFIASWMQYEFREILPILLYSDPSIPASPFITGFPLFDSIVSGNWDLAGSIILHGILPMITLSFVIIVIIIKQTQTNIERNPKDTSFVSNSFTAGKIFGILFAFVLLVEITFNRTGFGYYFYTSIIYGDLFLINGCIFMIIIFFSFTMFFSNVIPIAYKFIRKKISKKFKPFREKIHEKFKFLKSRDKASPPISEPKIKVEKKSKTKPKIELKNYVITTLKNPFTIVGLGLILFLAIISAFPQLLTPYSLSEITPPHFPPGVPNEPPSPDHPLGTTKYGFDLLARVIYGTRDALIFGSVVTLIGLAGGSIFGFLSDLADSGRLHRYVHNGIIGSMVVFFIIPGLMLLILSSCLFGRSISVMTIGFLLIINFTGIIANAIRRESNYINIIKVIIKYIPLEMAFGIMLYQMLGYLGLGDETTAQLGISFNYGRGSLFATFRAMFWPGFFIFIIMLSLILLHEGLKAPTAQDVVLNEPVITS